MEKMTLFLKGTCAVLATPYIYLMNATGLNGSYHNGQQHPPTNHYPLLNIAFFVRKKKTGGSLESFQLLREVLK